MNKHLDKRGQISKYLNKMNVESGPSPKQLKSSRDIDQGKIHPSNKHTDHHTEKLFTPLYLMSTGQES